MKKQNLETAFDEKAWEEKIHKASLRVTGGRLAVLRVLSMAHAPLSHSELVSALKNEPFDQATIFRNLNNLTDAGLVEKKDLGDRTWRFELKRNNNASKGNSHEAKHPHFTCTDCGEVQCLPETTIGIRSGNKVPKSVIRKRVQITLQGVCDSCH